MTMSLEAAAGAMREAMRETTLMAPYIVALPTERKNSPKSATERSRRLRFRTLSSLFSRNCGGPAVPLCL